MSQQLRPPAFSSFGKVLFLNEEFKDIAVVVVTDCAQWRFPAHKLVLASESPFLRKKLEEDKSAQEIQLGDATPATGEMLLRFMYSGELELERWHEGVNLIKLAFHLEMPNLVQKCARFLEEQISLTNVCYIYEASSLCMIPALQDKCLKLILDAGFLVLRSSAFEVLPKDCITDIVTSSELNIDSELVVFETLFRWARIECCRQGLPVSESNILTQIKPFLQHVCIDDMSDADKSALPPSILSCVKPNNRNRIGFSVLDSLLPFSHCLDLYSSPNSLDFIGENQSCFRFSMDAPMILLGLKFTVVAHEIPLQLPLTLVKENNPKATLFSHNLSTGTIASSQINQTNWHQIKILLRQPVFLKPGEIYNLCMTDASTEVQCPQTVLLHNKLYTPTGCVNFTTHGKRNTWGITSLSLLHQEYQKNL